MGLFGFFKKKNKKGKQAVAVSECTEVVERAVLEPEGEMLVSVESLPALTETDKSKLAEITDSTVLARIDAMLPAVGSTVVHAANAVTAAKPQADTYKVILKNSGKLVSSVAVPGAKRAMAMGKNGHSRTRQSRCRFGRNERCRQSGKHRRVGYGRCVHDCRAVLYETGGLENRRAK